ncbi:hypothetical protein [Streptomyces bambusae]|uniref:Bulb-type lectin domain-containing protein n=1 Tax=Streptomyces bambusae TaxID=1550616 RepID=A0ABS6Z1K3_9ACTN|nr:hypothetical protein [Streptomyces bambusae]MBW5480696.1 hypothetical protein [Streptomyces bambusae]
MRKRAAWTGALIASAVAAGVLAAPAAQAADGAGTFKHNATAPQKAASPKAKAKAKAMAASKAKAAATQQRTAGKADARALAESAAATTATTATTAEAGDTLQPGQKLLPGEFIVSENAFLLMQEDGNLVIGHMSGADLWATGTFGNDGAYAQFQADGNFVVYKKDGGEGKGGALWNSATWGNPNSRLTIQEDGNVVLYRQDNSPAWSSRTWRVGDNTLSAGENLDSGTWMDADQTALVMDARGYFGVFEKFSEDVYMRGYTNTYSPGAYARMQADGNFVIYKKGGGEGKGGALWNTATWGKPGARMTFERNSHLELRTAGGELLWDGETGDDQQPQPPTATS